MPCDELETVFNRLSTKIDYVLEYYVDGDAVRGVKVTTVMTDKNS